MRAEVDRTRVPAHIAVIMDGTALGETRFPMRIEGHRKGAEAVGKSSGLPEIVVAK
jgi:undecaprenyl pyrophosphate synthase